MIVQMYRLLCNIRTLPVEVAGMAASALCFSYRVDAGGFAKLQVSIPASQGSSIRCIRSFNPKVLGPTMTIGPVV